MGTFCFYCVNKQNEIIKDPLCCFMNNIHSFIVNRMVVFALLLLLRKKTYKTIYFNYYLFLCRFYIFFPLIEHIE